MARHQCVLCSEVYCIMQCVLWHVNEASMKYNAYVAPF